MASKAVTIVDPYSTGCCLALECFQRGFKIIALWSREVSDELKTHRPSSCDELVYIAELTEGATVAATAQSLRDAAGEAELIAVIVGGESGVPLADAVSEHMGLRTNGTQIPQRRDKKLQQELVKAAGLRSVRQAGGKSLADVETFLQNESMPVVVKPVESAGSDGVKLCHSIQEAKDHFTLLMSAQQKVGSQNASVLCQECLKGKEYVIDHVSVDGVHKTVMLWVYDKRAVNGAAYVYHGMLPVAADSEEAKLLIPYIRGVLDAMQIKNGATHGEAIMTEDGPCLVEMNCRCHGGDGSWVPLAKALTGGYAQVNVTADSFLDLEAFKRIPDVPPSPFKADGQEVLLVSFTEGKVVKTPGYDMIRQMESFLYLEASIKPGDRVERTVDLFTNVGSAILMNKNKTILQKDVDSIRAMEQDFSMFELEEHPFLLKRPRAESFGQKVRAATGELVDAASPRPAMVRKFSDDMKDFEGLPSRKPSLDFKEGESAVVVVDPLSTGCCVADEIIKRGFKVIAVWSKDVSAELKKHIPWSCEGIEYLAEVTESASIQETKAAVTAASGSFTVVAVICGAETGVPCADALSESMGLRTNGTQIPQRRDKKIQQELVKNHGLRSVRQAGGKLLSDVEEFLKTESMPVVVKPVESAGSDGVKLCHTIEEATEHFQVLMKAQNKVGSQGAAVLCQEFLKGKEYVVDMVSMDGVHKTVMIWVYDKRPANGSAFVYFGMVPVRSDSPEAKVLIPYVKGVLDALQIKNGPTHGEVMMTADGPCLVEMNCRAHGGDGTFVSLARTLTGGYSQVDAAVDSFLDKAAFAALPEKPPAPFKASGQEVILVSFSKGTVKATPGLDAIKKMDSFLYLETGVNVGSKVEYSVDLFTNVGSVIVMNKDAKQLQKDIDAIRQMEKDCALFEFEDHAEVLGRPRASSELKPHVEELASKRSWRCSVM